MQQPVPQQPVPLLSAETVVVVGYDPFSNLAEVSLDQLKASSMFIRIQLTIIEVYVE